MLGIPSLKDRVIVAIFMYRKLVPGLLQRSGLQEVFGDNVEKAMVEQFREEVSERPRLFSEFNLMVKEVPADNQRKIYSSLELNLMLTFLYLAALNQGLPVLEKDLLVGAQTDSFGYLTAYKHFPTKKHYLLRPVNVPFKNKWLRDSLKDLV